MIAYMFPGQGSQFPGMGQELFVKYAEHVDQANNVLGYSIADLCIRDQERRLNRTRFTQPAIFFVSCLYYLERKRRNALPDLVLGHSLGLYSALFAAAVFDLQTGLEIVARRGALMEAASDGAMLAVISKDPEALTSFLAEYGHDIDIANYNSPSQAVLSCMIDRVEVISRDLERAGFKTVRLPVSGPFHSRYMEPARVEFMKYLLEREFQDPSCMVVSTTSGSPITADYLLEELCFQLVRPVRWAQTIKYLAERIPDITFQEIGPSRVLSRLTTETLAAASQSLGTGTEPARKSFPA
jgi:malonyl CoA-acyl carrier protein transacylase